MIEGIRMTTSSWSFRKHSIVSHIGAWWESWTVMASGGVATTEYNHSWLTVLNKSWLKEPPTIAYQSSVGCPKEQSSVSCFSWCLSMTFPTVSSQVHASLQMNEFCTGRSSPKMTMIYFMKTWICWQHGRGNGGWRVAFHPNKLSAIRISRSSGLITERTYLGQGGLYQVSRSGALVKPLGTVI